MLLALLLAVSAPPPPPAESGPRHHGLFLRLDLGLGYYSSANRTDSFSGGGAGFGFSLGGNIGENLALFGSLFDAGGGAGGSTPALCPVSGCPITSAGIGGIGVGLTYYLMPANVFFSGTLALGALTTTSGGVDSVKRTGLLARVGAGKEWFISESWGLGVAGYLLFGSNKDDAGASAWTTVSPLLAFSATFY